MLEHNQELFDKPSKLWRLLYVNRVWFAIFGIIVASGLYIGYLLFGSNSVEVLLQLRAQKMRLIQNAQMIEEQNARLQRRIFELNGVNFEK
ncbi:hypothetical protein [Helicobacter marmotae]|uniref:Septum formation initiator n=1 Tax=Helicobacter marmotae TaxID=152490 RepID=A0A3D8I331_9HELI|nr:hypothetical protein [Helicobacter marmotae]RDU59518.1 hypothetical protein CQA63_06325 [Helicobacter marmotae]